MFCVNFLPLINTSCISVNQIFTSEIKKKYAYIFVWAQIIITHVYDVYTKCNL